MKQILNILIIEDNPSDAGLIIRHIQKAGYELIYERIESPEALKQALETKEWHVVLSDYNMPLLNGYEALEIVNKFDSNIPFILISGAIGEEAAVRVMKAGACDLIIKDNLSRLVPAIERGIEDAKTRRMVKHAQKALKAQAKRETLLRTIIESIRKTLDIDEIRQNLVNVVGEKLNADKCFFWDYDNYNKEFIQQIKFGYETSPDLRKPYTYGEKTDNTIIETYRKQGYIYVPDFSKLVNTSGQMSIISRHQIEYHGIRTNCCFGLFDGDKFLGAFAVQYKEVTELSNEDIELLKSIVNQTVIALKQAELYSKTKKQAERERRIREITETVGSSLDSAEIQNKIVTIVANIFKPDKCFIRPFDNKNDAFVPVEEYAQYCSSPDLKKAYCFSDEVENFVKTEYKKGNSFIVSDFTKFFNEGEIFSSIAKRQIEHYGILANYCFPILVEKRLIGAFVLQFKKKTYLEPEDVDLLKTIVNHIAISLRQAELFAQAQNASKAKSEFLAIMSHEIRTPLGGVSGFLQLLSDTDLTDKQKKYVDNIKTSSESLLSIIGDVLDFSKIEANKIEIVNIEFNLHALINESILNARANGYKKGLDINAYIHPDVPSMVIGDSGKLRQILTNLFNNAIKFTSEGHIFLKVKLLNNENNKVDIYFEVADTGIGISEENIEKIFQPFTQADNFVGRKYGGTGLGLAICERLLSLMGGTLAIESKVNKGSRIAFNIQFSPLLEAEEIVIVPDEKRMSKFSLEKFKILLVEDTNMNIELFSEILDSIKLKFDLAMNGLEAVNSYKNNNYDLILMDCELPGISGYEATGQIRKLEKDEKHIPIIAMTAHAMCGEKEKCIKAGMDDHISKPVDIELFKSMVKGYLIAPPLEVL